MSGLAESNAISGQYGMYDRRIQPLGGRFHAREKSLGNACRPCYGLRNSPQTGGIIEAEDIMAKAPRKPAAGEKNGSSLVQYVVESIIEGVMKGRYAPGQRLIASDLAEDFDVSRAPVREALHVLAGEGVVDLIPNRGARIRKLPVTELVDFLELTEAILVLGIRRAMENIHEEENRKRMEGAFERIKKAWEGRDSVQFVFSLADYHRDLNAISGNSFVDFFYRRPYIDFFNRLLADRAPGGHWDHFLENYTRIQETVMRGDAHMAQATFVSHIQWVLDIMREADAEAAED